MELFQLAPVSAAYSVEKQQIGLGLYGVLTPLSIIFQLYHGSHFIGGGNRST